MKLTYFQRLAGESKIGIADVSSLENGLIPFTCTIHRISIPEKFRKQGHGGRLLRRILHDADLENMALSLTINPSGSMNFFQLEKWYMRHGFTQSKVPGVYIRQPDGSLPYGEKGTNL